MANDSEIVNGLKKAQPWAVEALVDTYGDRLLRTIVCVVKDYHTAEELVQETFLKVCDKIESFRGDSSLYTWIYRIGINLSRNYLRKRKPQLIGKSENLDFYSSQETTPYEHTARTETINKVHTAMQQLSPIYREILALFYLEDLQVQEISSILNTPEGTVKSRLSRGRTQLKQVLIGKEAPQIGRL